MNSSIRKKIQFFFRKKMIVEEKPSLLTNVFNSNFNKKALLSFLIAPFIEDQINYTHSNKWESLLISELLNHLKYKVDVINYDDGDTLIENKYDLIIGVGEPIERLLFGQSQREYKLILYRNGAENTFSDELSLKRIYALYKKTNKIFLQSSRIYPLQWKAQHFFADAIIALGNNFVAEKYKEKYPGKVYSVDLFYFDIGTIKIQNKDFSLARNNFLWFGSAGAVHKGLDLVLDFFSKNKHLNLYIAGLNKKEDKFIQYYKDSFSLPNIFNLGFVQLQSNEFKVILNRCGAIITPTISEGGGGATVNVIAAGGLLPIVTKNIGLDFYGYETIITEFNLQALSQAISKYLAMTNSQLKESAQQLMACFREKHTIDKFKEQIQWIIENTVNNS